MKIKEVILNETVDTNELYKIAVADPFGAAGSDFDMAMNPEASYYAERERKNTPKGDFTPVYAKDITDESRKKMDTHPEKDKVQSPGFRGREKVKQRANIPHFPFDESIPDYKPYNL